MTPSSALLSASHDLAKSRGWLIAGGILSVIVGFVAMSFPFVFSLAIAQLLGVFALVSGLIALGLALLGKHQNHRVLEVLSAIIRIVAGIVLLNCVASAVTVITLIFSIYLIVEGIFQTIAAFKLRAHPGWIWTLVSGVAAIVLGLMVQARWPSDSVWVLGTLLGINLIFSGASLLALGLAAGQPAPPVSAS